MDDDLQRLLGQGLDHYRKGDLKTARRYLEQTVLHCDHFADVHNMLGIIYHDAGLFSKSQAAFERAVQLNPDYTEASLNLAVLYNDLGKYAEAKATYHRALHLCRAAPGELDPFVAGKIANMHAEVAEAYLSAGRVDDAIDELRKALRLRPSFADLRTKLAQALHRQGNVDEAVAELDQALEDRPEYAPARVHLGVCYYGQGRQREALAQWRRAAADGGDRGRAAMYLRVAACSPNATS